MIFHCLFIAESLLTAAVDKGRNSQVNKAHVFCLQMAKRVLLRNGYEQGFTSAAFNARHARKKKLISDHTTIGDTESTSGMRYCRYMEIIRDETMTNLIGIIRKLQRQR